LEAYAASFWNEEFSHGFLTWLGTRKSPRAGLWYRRV
jgi:hypothetical protein